MRSLRALGYDPQEAVSVEKARRIKAQLQAADITPARMRQAVTEARRAAKNGQSTLEWIRAALKQAHSERLAEQVFLLSKARLKESAGPESADLQSPPSPEQAFAFLLLWEELGGTAGVAASRELSQVAKGQLPSN